MYALEPLRPEESMLWDELIAPFEGRELFHRKVWLDYLAASRGVEIRFWAVREGSRRIGYFCGGLTRKGPFRILGSPLRGWGTNFMGPLVSPGVDQDSLLRAVDKLARAEGFAMVELEHRLLGDSVFLARGYEAVPTSTYIVSLTRDPELMWQSLESTCRNRIRKARRMGLTVEDTDDPTIADEFYNQYTDVMQRKGLVPSYRRQVPQVLFRYLKKADLLFALRVRDERGRTVATGLFPHDGRTVYFWGGASWHDGRALCPNDLLHWSAMCLAADRGLVHYNMSGDGRFKRKFGGSRVALKRWRKCYSWSARWAQHAYQLYFEKRISLGGWLRRAWQSNHDF